VENRIEKILVGCRNNERGSQKALYLLSHKLVSSICYRYGVRYHNLQGRIREIVVLARIEHYRKEIAISNTHNLLAETSDIQKLPQYGITFVITRENKI